MREELQGGFAYVRSQRGLVGLIVHYTYELDYGFVTISFNFHNVGFWLLAISVIFSLTSGGEYIRGFIKAIEKTQPA